MNRLLEHTYILSTVAFTVYSQLIMRWQVGNAGPLPEDALGKAHYIGVLLMNPWVMSGILATFLAGVSWMLAMTKFEISYAFPFVGLTYILIPLAGVLLFNEGMNVSKAIGTGLVLLGILVMARA